VRYVLERSVRKAGEQVRVTAQLIDARTDRHLWSKTFDRRLDDIFTIQDELAKQHTFPLKAGLWSNQHAEMRSDPRFIEVMARFGFVYLWQSLGPPPDCRADGVSFTCGHGREPLEFNLPESAR